MADYNINAVTRRAVFTGSAGLGPYAFTFEIIDSGDLAVYFNATKLTITTDYTVSINANGTGDVTIVTGGSVPSTPTASDQIVIVGARDIERVTDFVTAGDLLASSLNEQLDALTIFDQQVSEEGRRAMRAPVYDPALAEDGGVVDMTLPTKASRAGKTLAFDSDGNPTVGEDIGNWRGDWAASVAYGVRDIVRDASNYNIYRCNTAHTSSGSTPISSNADVAKWDLVIDASYAATQAANAAASATAAATSATNSANSATASATSASASSTSATNAATSETNAATSATNAATSATAAANSAAAADATFDLFDDAYLGAKASDPTLDNDGNALQDGALYFDTTNNVMKVYDLGTTTWFQLTPTVANQTNINTVAGIASDVTAVAGNSANINAVAADASDIGTVATNIANVNAVGGDITNVNTVATNLTDINSFANTYFISATAPSSPTEGDLWFDTTNDIMKVYDGSGFVNAGSSVNGTANRVVYTATAGQTTFSATYDAGYVDVYLNGVKLIAGTDFTATDGTSVVLASGAALNDTVDIVAYGTFNLLSTGINDLTDVNTSGITNGQVLAYNSTSTNFEPTTITSDLVDDTTPQLGGNLDVQTHSIVSTSNRDINITPNGTGNVNLGNFTFDADQTVGAGQDNYLLTYDHSTTSISLEAAPAGGAGYFQGENGATGDTTNGKGDIFRVHEQQLDTNTTIAAGDNAGAFFSLTVATGVTLTVNGNLVIA